MGWQFVTNCVNAVGEDINAMTAAAKPSSFRAMRKIVGEAFVDLQGELGYDIGAQRGGLRMSKDWHVSYHRSTYRGRPCFYFVWSHIEHIFCEEDRS